MAVVYLQSDLEFILQQIIFSERHANGEDLNAILPNVFVPWGLRTVDGSFNNLVFGQEQFGAADELFPRLVDPTFRDAEDVTIDLDGPDGQAVGDPTSYQQTRGFVFNSQPRTISNLVVDQTANNPAAYANAYDPGVDGVLNFGAPGNDDVLKDGVEIVASPGLDGVFGTADDREVFFFGNTTPDEGLSAGFNAWFTFFGQFFDHGLDLVDKGSSGTIFIPLQADDPLIAGADGQFGTPDDLPPQLRFMVLTRATNQPGPDGVQDGDDPTTPGIDESADDVHEHENSTTPFVDQNQTYTSHPSHQVFLREYALNGEGKPVATGKLITNHEINPDGSLGVEIGGMATWAVVKAQASKLLGIQLTDHDAVNVPLVKVDAYGKFIPDPTTGFAQLIIGLGLDDIRKQRTIWWRWGICCQWWSGYQHPAVGPS